MRIPKLVVDDYVSRAVFEFADSDTDISDLSHAQLNELRADADWYSDPDAVDIDAKLRAAYRKLRDGIRQSMSANLPR